MEVSQISTAVEELFRKSGALLTGHFLLTSGRHSPAYWEKFAVLQYPTYTEKLCRMISDHFRGQKVDLVAGPTTGGVILAYEVAKELGVRGIFAEKEGEERVFRRGFTIKPGERTLVVDDILTTGSSVREMLSAVAKAGGKLVGVGVLVDRSEEKADFGVPLFACHKAPTVTYPAGLCPLCTANIPLIKPGSSTRTV